MNNKKYDFKRMINSAKSALENLDKKIMIGIAVAVMIVSGAKIVTNVLPNTQTAFSTLSFVTPTVSENSQYYALSVDGENIAVLQNEEEAQTALDVFYESFGGEVLKSNVSLVPAIVPSNEIVTIGDALEILDESDMANISYRVDEVMEIEIPYEKDIIEDDTLQAGIEIVEKEGVNGVCERISSVFYTNGEVTLTLAPQSKVVSNPESARVRVGTNTTFPDTLTCPISGDLSSGFGERWGRAHTGIDIAAPTGTPIYAPVGGVVIFAGDKSGYGNYVQIDHGNGYVTAYAHMDSIGVEVGDNVFVGDCIGTVGTTGRVTGAHLHFEIIINGEFINPESYIKIDN